MSTNAEFIAAIQGLTVSGVTRHYDEPPASLDLTAGAVAFPTMPNGERGEMVTSCADMSKTRSMGYVIVLIPTGQGTQAQNYARLAALMDALEDALDALTPTMFNFIEYSISTTGNYPVGSSDHWAIIANITERDA